MIADATPADCFFPEDFTEEQRQIAQTTAEFAINEIVPVSDAIEAKDFAVTRRLIKRGERAGADLGGYSGGVRRAGDGQGDVGDRCGEHCEAGQLLAWRSRRMWGLGRCRSSGTGRRSRSEVPAEAGDRASLWGRMRCRSRPRGRMR